MRTFVAVEISEEARGALCDYQRQLQAFPAAVRWVQPHQMHLTLKFLGEMDSSQQNFISEALGQITGATTPFEAEIQGLGAFPSFLRPQVLWTGVSDGHAPLIRLAHAVEAALIPLGFPKEKKGFHPHVTLGRVKSGKGLAPLCAQMEKDAQRTFGRFPVKELVFFESILSSSGATYTALRRFSLRYFSGESVL